MKFSHSVSLNAGKVNAQVLQRLETRSLQLRLPTMSKSAGKSGHKKSVNFLNSPIFLKSSVCYETEIIAWLTGGFFAGPFLRGHRLIDFTVPSFFDGAVQ